MSSAKASGAKAWAKAWDRQPQLSSIGFGACFRQPGLGGLRRAKLCSQVISFDSNAQVRKAEGISDERGRHNFSWRMPLRTNRFRGRGPSRARQRMQLLDLHEEGVSPLDRAAASFQSADAGEDVSTYTFNTSTAKHYFCPDCGVASFYIPRSDPDKIDVNARCVDGVELAGLDQAFRRTQLEEAIKRHRAAHKVIGDADFAGERPDRISALRAERKRRNIEKMAGLGFTRDRFRRLQGRRLQRAHAGDICARAAQAGEARRRVRAELARKLHLEFFPHVARHARRTVNPPPETWAAFGPSPKGYKRYGYLAFCISGAGLHARMVVKSEADRRAGDGARAQEPCRPAREVAARNRNRALREMGFQSAAGDRRVPTMSSSRRSPTGLGKKTGGLDLGFGWSVRDALRLDRAELLDAYRELEPVYRIVRAVV